jgi:Ca-activated chloride channel family protein
MKRTTYSRYTGELADDIDLEDLMQQLSDYLLDSGFESPLMRFQEFGGEKSLDNLREALRQALEYGDFEKQIREKLDQMSGDPEQIDQLIEQLMHGAARLYPHRSGG